MVQAAYGCATCLLIIDIFFFFAADSDSSPKGVLDVVQGEQHRAIHRAGIA